MKFLVKYSKYILFVLGLIVFIRLISEFGIDNIVVNLSKTGWWIVPVIAIWGAAYLLNTLSLAVVLGKGYKLVGFRNSLFITISGFAINYITPFASVGGEPFRVMKLKNYIGTPAAVSKVVLCKMLQLFSHFILWLATIIIMLFVLPLSQFLKLGFGALFVVIIIFSILFIKSHKSGVIWHVYSGIKKLRIKPLIEYFRKREDSIFEADENIKELFNQRRGAFYLALFIEFSARIVSSLEFYFILKSIGFQTSVFQAIYINSISSLFINIFFFVPLSLGVRESSLLLIMKTINVTSGIGVFIAVINRIREIFWIVIGIILIKFIGEKSIPDNLKTGNYGTKDESIII